MKDHLPILLNVDNKKILIVGGGETAFEQILYILETAPNSVIRLVSKEVDEKIKELQEVSSDNFTIIEKEFENSDLYNQEMVFIALSDNDTIQNIAKEAKKNTILVNALHQPYLNDFQIQLDTQKSSEIQTYTANHWKKIAFTSIIAFFILIFGNILSLFISYDEVSAGVQWLFGEIDELFYWMILVGFVAQLIDGLLGMGYGLSSTAALLSIGIPLPAISGSIHTAEMFSSGASGLSHYKFGNVNKKLLKFLIFPGVIGAVSGAGLLVFLSDKYSDEIKILLATYTLLLGIRILYKAFNKKQRKAEKPKNVGWLAFGGGFLDSFCGGGWGPLVTSTLISKGKTPRFVIGTVSLAEFFITFSSALTFFVALGLSHWQVILGLVIGGVLAAPLAAKLAGKLPVKTMFICVGLLVIIWSVKILYKAIL